jgi:hypothetical protein
MYYKIKLNNDFEVDVVPDVIRKVLSNKRNVHNEVS